MRYALLLTFAFVTSITSQLMAEQDIPGPTVGTKAPDFELLDQEGKAVTLEQLCDQGTVALVFFRSADWCPYCKRHLVQLSNDLESLKKGKVQLVAISYDPVKTLQRFSSEKKIGYPLLSDTKSEVIKAFSAHHQRGYPYPGTVIVDSQGVIRAKLFYEGYKRRQTVAEILKAASESS